MLLPATVSRRGETFSGLRLKKIPDSICLAGDIYSCTANIFFSTTRTSLLVCLRRAHLIKHLVNANVLHSRFPFPFFFPKGPCCPSLQLSVNRALARRGEERKKKKKKHLRSNSTVSESNKKLREKLSGRFYVLVALCLCYCSDWKSCPLGHSYSSVGRAEEIIFHM